jgi:hypothetical protein
VAVRTDVPCGICVEMLDATLRYQDPVVLAEIGWRRRRARDLRPAKTAAAAGMVRRPRFGEETPNWTCIFPAASDAHPGSRGPAAQIILSASTKRQAPKVRTWVAINAAVMSSHIRSFHVNRGSSGDSGKRKVNGILFGTLAARLP